MAVIGINEKSFFTDPQGKPVYIVGINYVPSYSFTNMWDRWTPEIIERDLKTISEWGLNAIRVMLFWRHNEPQQGVYNPVFFDQFDTLLKYSKKYGLYVMPCFLCHYSEGDCDIPWRKGRPFYTGDMVEIAANHLKYFIKKYKDEEQILLWDIFDEPEWNSRNEDGAEQLPFDRNATANWVKVLYDAIKSVDPNHLVTLGFGHIASMHYGMHVKDMAEILDVMSITAYPSASNEAPDTMRQNYWLPHYVRFQALGKPVFTCEAPGHTCIHYSEEIVSKYSKVSYYSNLINGSNGVLPWVYSDIEENIWYKWPLDQWTAEPHFGVKSLDGRLKPAAKELINFARFVKDAGITGYGWPNSDVAILVPEGYYGLNTAVDYKKVYTSFVLVKSVGGMIDYVWDDEDFSKYRLLIISCTAKMRTPTWNRIREYVKKGGNVYFAYDEWRGALNAYFNELFGIKVQSPDGHGVYKSIRITEDWEGLKSGDEIAVTSKDNSEYLKIKVNGAKVIAEFADGMPAVTMNKYGLGKAYLAAYPLENNLMDIQYDSFVGNGIFKLYDSLLNDTGVNRPVKCPDHRVEIGVMEREEGREQLFVCINHYIQPVHSGLYCDEKSKSRIKSVFDVLNNCDVQIYYDGAGIAIIDLSLEEAGVCVYKVMWEKL